MNDHRIPPKPPHYNSAVQGQCRWCGEPVVKADGSVNRRARWHPSCVREYKLIHWPKETRKAVYRRDKGICGKCGKKCARKYQDVWHLDHIVPLIEAQGNLEFWKLPNLQTLCQTCHKEKSTREASQRAARRAEKKMAEFTIHKWDSTTDTTGAAKVLRDHAGIAIREAKAIIDHCKAGGSKTIQVPFSKKSTISEALNKRGFSTS